MSSAARSRSLLLCLLCLLCGLSLGASGGPDAGDLVFVDGAELDGPPAGFLDLSAFEAHALGEDEWLELPIPFAWSWYGGEPRTLYLSARGALFFDGPHVGETPRCPGEGSWSGVAAHWSALPAGVVRVGLLGDHPYRVLAVEWSEVGRFGLPGRGAFQAWLLEGRGEVVIALQDLDFGSASFDGGVGAVIGVEGPGGEGLAWSCEGVLDAPIAAWFGARDARTASSLLRTGSFEYTFSGVSSYAYAGRSLAVGDADLDGLSDLLVGDPDLGPGRAYLLLGGAEPATLSEASLVLSGESARDQAGRALALGDLDGDGVKEIYAGAPERSVDTAPAVGRVYGVIPGRWGALGLVDADLVLDGPSGSSRPRAGSVLVVPGDVDGDGYDDLLVGVPESDAVATNAGAACLWSGGPWSGGRASLADADAIFLGRRLGDQLGRALTGGDIDADGLADLLLAAPYADDAAADAGRILVIPGGAWSGPHDADEVATLRLDGASAGDTLGASLALGRFEGSSGLGLLAGIPASDLGSFDGGAVALLLDPLDHAGTLSVTHADALVRSLLPTGHLGEQVAAGDIDGDGWDDLFLAAPNASAEGVSGGGVVYVLRDTPSGDVDAEDADHRILGSASSGAAGTALAFLTCWDADGYGDLAVGLPYADLAGLTMSGGVALWDYQPSYADVDRDGFVSVLSAGLDCDDADAAVFPGAPELAGNVLDDDCDGWIDDVVRVRLQERHFDWDLVNLHGDPPLMTFDFEDASLGADLRAHYASRGLVFSGDGPFRADDDVFGTAPVGRLAGAFTPTGPNVLVLDFAEGVDLLSLRLLDGRDAFTASALTLDGLLFAGLPLDLAAEDRPGGRFVGLAFSEPIRTLALFGESDDGFGLDELRVGWSAFTDADGDGYTEDAGDCDDRDAAVHPGAEEDFENGIDDDCDGLVDTGGIRVLDDEMAWRAAADPDLQRVDFEGLDPGEMLAAQYLSVGVLFEEAPSVVTRVDGAAPRGERAARLRVVEGPDVLRILFTEAQPAVAFQLLDAEARVDLRAWTAGGDAFRATFDAGADDLAGGVFVGLLFDASIVSLEIRSSSTLDVLGIDDLLLSALGLDDADGDGYTEAEGDCDDASASVHPGAPETWYDGIDADCDGASDFDADGDGYPLSLDCDDASTAVHPDAPETWYDGIDADCDGLSDWDRDGDGFDAGEGPGLDCDDDDPGISPGEPEVFYDGEDRNCDPSDEWDADGDGFSLAGSPTAGAEGTGDCDDGDADARPGAPETWYDGVDSDCDGGDDFDADGDGFALDLLGGNDCDDEDDAVHPGMADPCYDGVDQDCDGASDYDCDRDGHDARRYGGDDCDDAAPAVHPGAPDAPYDDLDSDCDGLSEWDADRDGYEAAASGGLDCDDGDPEVHPDAAETCGDGMDANCDGRDDFDCDGDGQEPPERGGLDCDDTDATVHPGAADTCYDGIDTNCDGRDDFDCDRDGHRPPAHGGLDCDDADATVHPGAEDWPYDGIDADCDGAEDLDADGDGHASLFYGGDDCDDFDAGVHPGARERCLDGVDQDCDGRDGLDCDGDGHDGALLGGDDCDDEDPEVHPGASDPCGDGIDANCDGGDSCEDLDGDGFEGAEAGGADCDDHDASVHPGAVETCYDGLDQDCDGRDDGDCDRDGHVAAWAGGDDCDDADARVHPGASERWYDGVDQDCDGRGDYDQDGDGYDARPWGGTDCDDLDPRVNPGRKKDGCGLGDEDCDGRTDEDCVPEDSGGTEDSGDSEETGDDSGSGDDSGGGEESADDRESGGGGDSGEGTRGGRSVPWATRPEGCGACSNAEGGGSGFALLLAGALLGRRRARGQCRSCTRRTPRSEEGGPRRRSTQAR